MWLNYFFWIHDGFVFQYLQIKNGLMIPEIKNKSKHPGLQG